MSTLLSYSRKNLALGLALLFVSAAGHAQLAPGNTSVKSATEFELERMTEIGQVYEQLLKFQNSKELQKQVWALQKLLTLRPYSTVFRWELARVYGQLGEKSAAYDTLIALQKQGMAFDPTTDSAFKPVSDTPAFKYIAEGLAVNAKPFGEGKVALTVQSDAELIESMAFDSKRNRFLFASAKTGEILSVDNLGVSKRFVVPDVVNRMSGVYALAIDAKNDYLYAASTMTNTYEKFKPEQMGMGGIYQFDLADSKLLKIFPYPADGRMRIISSMVVANNGDVYAADVASRSVMQIRANKLTQMFTSDALTGVRGIALSADNKRLYFSDYEMGLFYADLELSQIRAMEIAGHNLGGIDGIYLWDKKYLIALQNSTLPSRIVRIELNDAGTGIAALQPLEAAKPDMLSPTYGALKADSFYYIANSQRDLYDASGKIMSGEKPERRRIYRIDPSFGLAEAQRQAQALRNAEAARKRNAASGSNK